jgi:hypothetical protein
MIGNGYLSRYRRLRPGSGPALISFRCLTTTFHCLTIKRRVQVNAGRGVDCDVSHQRLAYAVGKFRKVVRVSQWRDLRGRDGKSRPAQILKRRLDCRWHFYLRQPEAVDASPRKWRSASADAARLCEPIQTSASAAASTAEAATAAATSTAEAATTAAAATAAAGKEALTWWPPRADRTPLGRSFEMFGLQPVNLAVARRVTSPAFDVRRSVVGPYFQAESPSAPISMQRQKKRCAASLDRSTLPNIAHQDSMPNEADPLHRWRAEPFDGCSRI